MKRGWLLLTLVGCLVAVANQTVLAQGLFPDKNLEKAVRKHVFDKRYTEDPITEEDVKYLSVIEAPGAGVKDLTGLEKCHALQELDLEDNEVVDVTPLAGLKDLQSLTLTNNQIEDITPLKELTKLQYLQLSGNQVKDIASLAGLTNMRSLYLEDNQISDVAAVKGMTKIWSLYLGGNQVKDLSPIQGLTGVENLDLRGNGISSLEAIKDYDDLSFLFLQENQLTDLSVLVEMAKKDIGTSADEPGPRNFAPFWRIYLRDNPLSDTAKGEQVELLKRMGARIDFEY